MTTCVLLGLKVSSRLEDPIDCAPKGTLSLSAAQAVTCQAELENLKVATRDFIYWASNSASGPVLALDEALGVKPTFQTAPASPFSNKIKVQSFKF